VLAGHKSDPRIGLGVMSVFGHLTTFFHLLTLYAASDEMQRLSVIEGDLTGSS
jgi:hypothetical protein